MTNCRYMKLASNLTIRKSNYQSIYRGLKLSTLICIRLVIISVVYLFDVFSCCLTDRYFVEFLSGWFESGIRRRWVETVLNTDSDWGNYKKLKVINTGYFTCKRRIICLTVEMWQRNPDTGIERQESEIVIKKTLVICRLQGSSVFYSLLSSFFFRFLKRL